MLRFQLFWLFTYVSLGLTSDTHPTVGGREIAPVPPALVTTPPRYVPGGARTGTLPSHAPTPTAKAIGLVTVAPIRSCPWGIHWAL